MRLHFPHMKSVISIVHANLSVKTSTQILYCLVLCLTLIGCSKNNTPEKSKILNVESKTFSNTLYYSGTIQPLKTVVVTSPADGVVLDMPIQYGEEVRPGQLLFIISSAKFLTDYKAALMQYVKTKNEFNTSKTQLSEGEFLHKNLLISDDDFKMKKSNYYAAQLALIQAKDTLSNLLQQLNIKDIDLYKLTISDIDKITQAMHLQMTAENLHVRATTTGILLSASKSEEESKKVVKGDNVKQGDVLAIIGDMSGLSVHIKVNELIVNQLKVGQKVKVSGLAFSEHLLEGQINRVDKQGEPSSSGLPTFSVEVIVPHLVEAERKAIHVGMSAKIEMNIEEAPQIMLPINAIREKNGAAYVMQYDERTRKAHEVLVATGKTSADSISILAGLNQGDKIVIPN